jgi:hypothetical protein
LNNLITIQDILIVPILLLTIFFISTRIQNKNIGDACYYKYFRKGLFIKILAGLFFAGVYLLYYKGGDTVYYFTGSQSIAGMLNKNLLVFFKLLFGNHSLEVYSMFDRTTGWPPYFHDTNAFAVSRFNVPFYILGFGSYLGNTIVMNFILFFGIWRFYKMLVELFPENKKWLAYAVFYVPSVVFWSSGILKDGWTLTAILFSLTNFYNIFIVKRNILSNILWLLFWSYISFSIRPYMFYATIASGLIWIGFNAVKTIESSFLRTIAMPFILLLLWASGSIIIVKTGSVAGSRYSSIDAMLETAYIIQDDLKKDYYGGNSFDIGSFEPTIPGILSKMPAAVTAGLFRPFIWEGNGILMLLSGIESLIFMIIITYILYKVKIIGIIPQLFKNSFILAIFVLAFTFAFSVGLTTANFGALVRYAIPVKILLAVVAAQIIFEIQKISVNNNLSKKYD